jgi:putative addiction module CopG family antidote
MNVKIPEEQRAIVEGLVAAGRFASVEEAISEGIRLLASSEQLRKQVQIGIEQADRGEVIEHDTVFAQLRAMAAATSSSGKE